jgi:hypothetical protein
VEVTGCSISRCEPPRGRSRARRPGWVAHGLVRHTAKLVQQGTGPLAGVAFTRYDLSIPGRPGGCIDPGKSGDSPLGYSLHSTGHATRRIALAPRATPPAAEDRRAAASGAPGIIVATTDGRRLLRRKYSVWPAALPGKLSTVGVAKQLTGPPVAVPDGRRGPLRCPSRRAAPPPRPSGTKGPFMPWERFACTILAMKEDHYGDIGRANESTPRTGSPVPCVHVRSASKADLSWTRQAKGAPRRAAHL